MTNTGERAGGEVVQFYIRAEMSRATRPVMELKGFRRITLAPGERRTVTFEVGPEQLSYHGPDLKRIVEPGRFRSMVGGSSAEVKSIGLDVARPYVPSPETGVGRADRFRRDHRRFWPSGLSEGTGILSPLGMLRSIRTAVRKGPGLPIRLRSLLR